MSAYCKFCVTKCLNIGVRVRLKEEKKKTEEDLGAQADVHMVQLIEGARLKSDPLNAGFIVTHLHFFATALYNNDDPAFYS